MDYFEKKQWIRIAVCAVLLVAVILALTGVFSKDRKSLSYQDPSALENEGDEERIEMLKLINLSMGNEQQNSYVTDYLQQDSYLVNIYEGYGFAKDYGSARGHSYTLEDVQKTERPHAKANCLTCKTPDMHKMIEDQGVSVYSMPFEEVMAQTTNTVSCYNCHGTDDGNNGQLIVTHQYVNEALGENASAINAASLACGQCHIEYYFTPSDSETMMPYGSVEEMTPEAILAYYDSIDFYDWEQPGTGTKMLKAQHPELETYLQGKHASSLSCADCHMEVKTTEGGTEYHDHHFVSPLSSEAILNKCAECHESGLAITARVREIQTKVTVREAEVGKRLSALKDTLSAAVESGQVSGEKLEQIRKLHREAQWFFDYCYVENSEGAHNSALATQCLDTADEKITEASDLLASANVTIPPELLSGKAAAEEETDTDGKVTVQGFGGEITVYVELNDDQTIKTLTIDTPNETAGLGKRVSEPEFTGQFIGKAAPFSFGENGIDMVSGASVTSTAALKAINKAASPGTASAEEQTEEKPAEEKQEEAKAEEKPAESAAADGQVYGSYRVTKENEYSKITVTVGTKNGAITSCKIQSEGEKDLLTDAIRDEWAKAIVDSGSASPDAITGATLKASAGSVQAAMEEILAQIGSGTAEPAEEKQEEAKAEEKPAESAAADGQVYGSYRVTKENEYSKITVTVGTKNGAITSCKIQSEGEKDLLTDAIRDEWAKAIVDSGSASPDAITGATLKASAGSVQAAMKDILARINGEAPEEEPTPEVTEAPTEEPTPEATEAPTEQPAS